MDAYEFFTKKHEKDIDYSNIYTLGRIYNLLGKYFPSAIKYLDRIMEKYPNDEYNLLFKEVTIKKKKYVNDKIKSIFELIYQRASTTKNDGIVKMVNDSIWILKRVMQRIAGISNGKRI